MPIMNIPDTWLHANPNSPQTINGKLSEGVEGNYETVRLMSEIAHGRKGHPAVRQLALKIVRDAGVGSMNYADEAIAIGEYVQKHVRYVRDPEGIEQLTDPIILIEQIKFDEAQGDCDDMALFIATLLLAIGHEPFFRMVRYKALSPFFNHIYVVDYERNDETREERIVLDAILKNHVIGSEVPHATGEEVRV